MTVRVSTTGLVVLCFASLLLVSSFANETTGTRGKGHTGSFSLTLSIFMNTCKYFIMIRYMMTLDAYVLFADAGRKMIEICIPSCPSPPPPAAPTYGGVPTYGGNVPTYGGTP